MRLFIHWPQARHNSSCGVGIGRKPSFMEGKMMVHMPPRFLFGHGALEHDTVRQLLHGLGLSPTILGECILALSE